MKKIITMILSGIVLCSPAFSQDYQRNGKEFSAATQKTSSSSDKKSGYTWRDSKGKVYDIYISDSGACYIKRISSKTGKEYRSYLSKEISAEICRELGIKRKDTK